MKTTPTMRAMAILTSLILTSLIYGAVTVDAEDRSSTPNIVVIHENKATQKAARGPADAEAAAREILELSGVQGGLIVHLGCGDGRLTAALGAGEGFLVHGLEQDAAQRERTRQHVRSLGLYGPVSIDRWDGRRLPYAENLVNLIVAQEPGEVTVDEMLRTLAPGGVALLRRGEKWTRTVKPWPEEMDQWTHFLHGPNNNAVADDTLVGPPRRLQWVSPPRWGRSHEHLASVSAAVSAEGRMFSIVDEGPTVDVAMPPDWTLLARDAFNGVLLWERPVGPWEWRLRGFRSGPPDLARRLVAVGDRVYVTLGYGKPVVALDAATGQIERVYEQTENTQEIVLADGVLYLVLGEEARDPAAQARRAAETDRTWHWWPIYDQPSVPTELLAVDAGSGEVLWHRTGDGFECVMPTTLAVSQGRVFFQNGRHLTCLDAKQGEEAWRVERPSSLERPAWSAPTLVVYDGVVLSADRKPPESETETKKESARVDWTVTSQGGVAPGGELIAFSADTGKQLWSAPCREGYNVPTDILVAAGLVWTGNLVGARDPGIVQGRDPHTGEVKRSRPNDQEFYQPIMSHARCYRHKATERYLVTGRSGVEFVDIATGRAIANHWVRGECQFGVIPCNGLLYAPPHPCACFILAKLNSFLALASGPEKLEPADAASDRLEKGPAYEALEPQPADSGDWPTYRHDPSRSGATTAEVGTDLKPAWETELSAPLTAPVAAGGRVYVASIETHTLHALDTRTGQPLWQFTAGGRVDSPPTIWKGRVLLGSTDGWVYCLRAEDGGLAWRYRAAPAERLVSSYGQLESAWPVHGSVLVRAASEGAEGVVYATAGRSGYLDGGIVMVRLDAASGRELSRTVIDSRDPATGFQPSPLPRPAPGFSIPGALNDVLSCQDDSVFMRHLRFDTSGTPQEETVPHLHSPAGFLDDSWWHRTYWLIGTEMHGGWGSWPTMGTRVPSGRLLVVGKDDVYGFGRDRYHRDGSHVGLGWANYRLFAQSRSADSRRQKQDDVFRWQEPIDMLARAMVLSGGTLFVAGPPDAFASEDPVAVWEGRAGGRLWAVSAESGERLAAYPLQASPVFDGMIATPGRLMLSTTDGRLACFAARQSGDSAR